ELLKIRCPLKKNRGGEMVEGVLVVIASSFRGRGRFFAREQIPENHLGEIVHRVLILRRVPAEPQPRRSPQPAERSSETWDESACPYLCSVATDGSWRGPEGRWAAWTQPREQRRMRRATTARPSAAHEPATLRTRCVPGKLPPANCATGRSLRRARER